MCSLISSITAVGRPQHTNLEWTYPHFCKNSWKFKSSVKRCVSTGHFRCLCVPCIVQVCLYCPKILHTCCQNNSPANFRLNLNIMDISLSSPMDVDSNLAPTPEHPLLNHLVLNLNLALFYYCKFGIYYTVGCSIEHTELIQKQL